MILFFTYLIVSAIVFYLCEVVLELEDGDITVVLAGAWPAVTFAIVAGLVLFSLIALYKLIRRRKPHDQYNSRH